MSADDLFLETNATLGLFGSHGTLSFNETATPALTVHTNNGGQEYVAYTDITFGSYNLLVDNQSFGAGNSIQLRADSILLSSVTGGTIQINSETTLFLQSDTANIQALAGVGTILLQGDTLTFNATGGQKVVVTTLANVIALLQSYGLAA